MKKKNILVFILTLALGVIIGKWVIPTDGASSVDTNEINNHVHTEEEYTCSMHPQIRQTEFGQCPICGMDLVLVGYTGTDDPFVTQMSLEASRLAQVHTSKVRKGDSKKEILLQGKVSVNEANETVISSRFPGRIEQLFVEYSGMEVKENQVLAEIYSPELIGAQNEFLEALKFEDAGPEIIESARLKLKLWNISDEQIATIESTKEIIQSIKIRSPYNGIVQKKYVHTGAYINEGTPMFQLVDLSHLWIVFDIYEEDLPWVKIGDEIEFRVASFPSKDFSAKVTFIDPVIEGRTRTLKIRLEVENEGFLLKPDMFVKGLLKANKTSGENQVIIPKTAVLWTGKRSVVYVESKDGNTSNYTYREVTIASDFGDDYLIESGLIEGEVIVTMGVFKVDAAAQLSGKYSMMNPPLKRQTIQNIPNSFSQKLNLVFANYLDLKNALVNSDLALSKLSMQVFNKGILNVKVSELDAELKNYWENWQGEYTTKIKNGPVEKDLEELRVDFSDISDLLIILTEDLSFQSNKVFKAYCPMALDFKGAYWLSEFEEIANPYFGESMLKCGSVEKVYK